VSVFIKNCNHVSVSVSSVKIYSVVVPAVFVFVFYFTKFFDCNVQSQMCSGAFLPLLIVTAPAPSPGHGRIYV
jgi:hypothetical protein